MSRTIETRQDHADGERRPSEDAIYKVDIGKLKNLFEDTDQRSGRGRQPVKPPPDRKVVNRSTRPTVDEQKNSDKPVSTSYSEREGNASEDGEAVKRFQFAKSVWAQFERNSASDNKFSADRKRSASPARPLGEHMEFQTAPTTQKLESSLLRPSVASKPVVANNQLNRTSVAQNASLPVKKSDLEENSLRQGSFDNGDLSEGFETDKSSSHRKNVERDAIVPSDGVKANERSSVHVELLPKASSEVTMVETTHPSTSDRQTGIAVHSNKESSKTLPSVEIVVQVPSQQPHDQEVPRDNARARHQSSDSDDSEKNDDYVQLEKRVAGTDDVVMAEDTKRLEVV